MAQKAKLFITLFHHKHGTSSALVAARTEAEADRKAEKFWIEVDGMEADPEERQRIDESYEVGEASAPAGYEVELRRRR